MTTVERPAAEATTPAGDAYGLPARFYTDPAIFSLERERVFGREWVPVARVDELEHAGDFVTYTLAGEPLVVVRGDDGLLRALSNVCRHRGMVMMTGRGSCSTLQCRYHLWAYGTDGRLRQAPHMGGSGFDRGAVSLPSFPVQVWQGWVFTCLDPAAEPVNERLAGLRARFAPYDLSRYRVAARLPCDAPWNWKLQVENYAESYHHAGTHPGTLEPLFPARYSVPAEHHDDDWFFIDHRPTLPELGGLLVGGAPPLLLFSVDQLAAVWFRLQVDAVDRNQLEIYVLENPEAPLSAPALDSLLASITAINDEDCEVLRATQAGMSSRLYQPGRLSHLERGVAQFHRWLAARLDIAAGPPGAG